MEKILSNINEQDLAIEGNQDEEILESSIEEDLGLVSPNDEDEFLGFDEEFLIENGEG